MYHPPQETVPSLQTSNQDSQATRYLDLSDISQASISPVGPLEEYIHWPEADPTQSSQAVPTLFQGFEQPIQLPRNIPSHTQNQPSMFPQIQQPRPPNPPTPTPILHGQGSKKSTRLHPTLPVHRKTTTITSAGSSIRGTSITMSPEIHPQLSVRGDPISALPASNVNPGYGPVLATQNTHEMMGNMEYASKNSNIESRGEVQEIGAIYFDQYNGAAHLIPSSKDSFVELSMNSTQQFDQSGYIGGQQSNQESQQGETPVENYAHFPNASSDSELYWALTPRNEVPHSSSSDSQSSLRPSVTSAQGIHRSPTTASTPKGSSAPLISKNNGDGDMRSKKTCSPSASHLAKQAGATRQPFASSRKERKLDDIGLSLAPPPAEQHTFKRPRGRPPKPKPNNGQYSPSDMASSSPSSSQPRRGPGNPPAAPKPSPLTPKSRYVKIAPRPAGDMSTATPLYAMSTKRKAEHALAVAAISGSHDWRDFGAVDSQPSATSVFKGYGQGSRPGEGSGHYYG